MAAPENQVWIYTAHPKGLPSVEENFRLEACGVDRPGPGEVLLRPTFFSVDPYLRGRMQAGFSYLSGYQIGKPFDSLFVAEVVESNDPSLAAGDTVSCKVGGHGPWKRLFTMPAGKVWKIDTSIAPPQAYLGVLGMPGMTAYFGSELGAPKSGETVFISGAAGAVGSIVGQLFKRAGCRVLGSAGSDEKVAQAKARYGYDEAWNYKTTSTEEALTRFAPEGVDIYFDNVGGETLDTTLTHMRVRGRIIACGSISQYNVGKEEKYGVKNIFQITTRQLRMEGFIVGRWLDRFPAAVADMSKWLTSGELKSDETVVEGFESLPRALLALFKGENVGKLVVKV